MLSLLFSLISLHSMDRLVGFLSFMESWINLNSRMLLTLVSHFCSALVSALTVLPLPSHCTFYNGHDTHLHQFFKLCKGKIHHLPNIWLYNGFLLWKGMHLAILKLSNKKLEKLQSIIGHIFLFSHFVPRHQPQELKHFSTFFLL